MIELNRNGIKLLQREGSSLTGVYFPDNRVVMVLGAKLTEEHADRIIIEAGRRVSVKTY